MRYFLIILLLFVCSCANKNYQSTAQSDFELAVEECSELSSALNEPEHRKGSLFWMNYFEMCMGGYGYTKEDYKHLWFN